jgi:hypothetical protein
VKTFATPVVSSESSSEEEPASVPSPTPAPPALPAAWVAAVAKSLAAVSYKSCITPGHSGGITIRVSFNATGTVAGCAVPSAFSSSEERCIAGRFSKVIAPSFTGPPRAVSIKLTF